MSKKKKRFLLEQTEVNVVPLMDILTTMLFFLILMASTANYATLFGIGNEGSGEQTDQVKFDLAIALHSDKKATIHLTDPAFLKPINQQELSQALGKRYSNSGQKILSRDFSAKSEAELLKKIQDDLLLIKKSFPMENRITLAIADGVKYQTMLSFMDAATQTDENNIFKLKDLIGRTRDNRQLFPEIALRGLSNDHIK